MPLNIAGRQAEEYQVRTDVYSGPLDLLLSLIEKAELDITRLALAQVTDQYLATLQNMQERDAGEVSAFLVIAARLVLIKSTALLPRPPVERITEEEDDGEALARQLKLYKRFKELAQWLENRTEQHLRTHLRLDTTLPSIPRADLEGMTLEDFVRIAREAFQVKENLPPISEIVSMPRVTLRERINTIMDVLKENRQANFSGLLPPDSSRLDVVITFLAMLELIKRHIIEAEQSRLFEDIKITSSGEWGGDEEIQLEFE